MEKKNIQLLRKNLQTLKLFIGKLSIMNSSIRLRLSYPNLFLASEARLGWVIEHLLKH